MPADKVATLSEAIARHVPDGSTIVMGTSLETLIPFAAGHELIRQRRRDLTLIGPISDALFDQVIGAGGVARVRAAWVGNVITGTGYNFRRAVEGGMLAVEDHSNFTIALGLRAAALGVPFLPTYTALGSDLFATNAALRTVDCPFTGARLAAVAALHPDVAIIHAQRADADGNAHIWGNLGVTREACLAADRVIVTCEELVAREVIRSDPNRVITPGFRVCAVVAVPWGAHPSPVPGCYNRDHQAYIEYSAASRTAAGFAAWQAEWVDGAGDPAGYAARLGAERLARLRLQRRAPAAAVDYGY
jgi:glutaconate CoA-transferase subunit A